MRAQLGRTRLSRLASGRTRGAVPAAPRALTPWSTEVALVASEHVRVSVMLSVDPGPMREFKPLLDVDLDEAHATELLGKLSLALAELRRRRAAS